MLSLDEIKDEVSAVALASAFGLRSTYGWLGDFYFAIDLDPFCIYIRDSFDEPCRAFVLTDNHTFRDVIYADSVITIISRFLLSYSTNNSFLQYSVDLHCGITKTFVFRFSHLLL